MLRRGLLCILITLLGCSSGGSSNRTSVPSLDWSTFRQNIANTGVGRGNVKNNKGQVTLLVDDVGGVTSSTPVIGRDRRIFLGTGNGLLALDENGDTRWRFDVCNVAPDSPCTVDTCFDVGPINGSATVTAGDDIVVAADDPAGAAPSVFRLHDEGDSFSCLWRFAMDSSADGGPRSSPLPLIDSQDLALISAFIGTTDGGLLALNSNGTQKWQVEPTGGDNFDMTSSPAVSAGGTLFVTAPDGFLYSLDLAGRILWSVEIGVGGNPGDLQPSPALGTGIYSIGAARSVFAINPDGTLKWKRETAQPVLGSPAVAGDQIRELKCSDSNAPCLTDEDCPVEICEDGECSQSNKSCVTDEDCPTETCRSVKVFDVAITVVDSEGTLYGFRDTGGDIFSVPRCSGSNDDCTNDDDCPEGEMCEDRPALHALWSEGPLAVSSSPLISGDFFVVAASDDGMVCARMLDGTVPDDEAWATGCISIGEDTTVRSSPVVDSKGRIFLTTDLGLYVIE